MLQLERITFCRGIALLPHEFAYALLKEYRPYPFYPNLIVLMDKYRKDPDQGFKDACSEYANVLYPVIVNEIKEENQGAHARDLVTAINRGESPDELYQKALFLTYHTQKLGQSIKAHSWTAEICQHFKPVHVLRKEVAEVEETMQNEYRLKLMIEEFEQLRKDFEIMNEYLPSVEMEELCVQVDTLEGVVAQLEWFKRLYLKLTRHAFGCPIQLGEVPTDLGEMVEYQRTLCQAIRSLERIFRPK